MQAGGNGGCGVCCCRDCEVICYFGSGMTDPASRSFEQRGCNRSADTYLCGPLFRLERHERGITQSPSMTDIVPVRISDSHMVIPIHFEIADCLAAMGNRPPQDQIVGAEIVVAEKFIDIDK
jgi:hypothetical protein